MPPSQDDVIYEWTLRHFKIEHGDLLLAMTGATIGKTSVWRYEEPALLNQRVGIIRSNSVYRPYLSYCAKAEPFTKHIELTCYGGAQENIGKEDIGNIWLVFPAYDEQRVISNYLDHETAKIDQLIARQERLIELLKEKRQAVISHTVTKGLNPDAPMKDSGVEWLGEVPAHWNVKRLKHISPRIGVGLVINPSTYVTDEGVPFLFGGDVIEYGFKLENTRKMTREDSNSLPQSRLSSGDLVCVRVGYPGITSVVPAELEGANCASMMVKKAGSFDSYWFCYAMNSWVGRRQVERVQYGAAQKQYNIGDAVEFVFPVPPIEEQTAIAEFLNDRFQLFGDLIEKAEKAITLQKEHRTALISAAVTGKIDVRGWQKPNTEPEKTTTAVSA